MDRIPNIFSLNVFFSNLPFDFFVFFECGFEFPRILKNNRNQRLNIFVIEEWLNVRSSFSFFFSLKFFKTLISVSTLSRDKKKQYT